MYTFQPNLRSITRIFSADYAENRRIRKRYNEHFMERRTLTWGRQLKGTLEAATMLAASLDGKQVNMNSDPQYDGNASLSNKRENPIWNNSLLSND